MTNNFGHEQHQSALGVWAHHAAWTQPLPVGYLGERWVEAVDVVGGWAGVTAQQLSSIFAHSAKLHVVILFLAWCLLFLLLLVFGLPLDTLLLLRDTGRHRFGEGCSRGLTWIILFVWIRLFLWRFMETTTLTYWDSKTERLRDHSSLVLVITSAQYICEKYDWLTFKRWPDFHIYCRLHILRGEKEQDRTPAISWSGPQVITRQIQEVMRKCLCYTYSLKPCDILDTLTS